MTTTTIKAYVTLTNGLDVVSLTPGNAGNAGINFAAPNLAEDMLMVVQDPVPAIRFVKGSLSTTSFQLQDPWTGATVQNAVVRISTSGAAIAGLTQSVRSNIDATAGQVAAATQALTAKGVEFAGYLTAEQQAFAAWKQGFFQRVQQNLDPASGRFFDRDAYPTANRGITLSAPFAIGIYQAYNGSTFAASAKFIHNNSTYGGSGAALAEPATSLVAAIKARSAGYGGGAYGVEYNIARLTQGSATVNGVSVSGVMHYLSLLCQVTVPVITFLVWVRVVSGSAYVHNASYRNGVASANGVVVPADGWVHLAATAGFDAGYTQAQVYGTPGAVFDIALPAIIAGDVRGFVQLSPVLAQAT